MARQENTDLANEDEPWSVEELALVLNAYFQRRPGMSSLSADEKTRLARLIRRSEGSVGRRIANYQSQDPEYTSSGRKGLTGGGRMSKVIFLRWTKDREGLAQLVADQFGKDDQQAPGSDLPEDFESLRNKALSEPEENRKRCMASTRRRQSTFRKAVLRAWKDEAADPSLCPGCGHGRILLTGDALLEAHHVVEFSKTADQDPLWGVPLCPNCHSLMHAGSTSVRRTITGNLMKGFPRLKANLRRLAEIGKLLLEHREQMREEGYTLPVVAALPAGLPASNRT